MLHEKIIYLKSDRVGENVNPALYEMQTENRIRENVLNNMDIAIYVSDLATNEILYANKNLRRIFEDNQLMGRCCWEAMYSRKKRCDYCPILYLLKNPGKSYKREFYNEALRKRFLIQASFIPWLGGKLAYLSCAADISELTLF